MKKLTVIACILAVFFVLAPFSVFGDSDTLSSTEITTSGGIPEEELPEVDIKEFVSSAVLYCVDTDTVLYSKNADKVCSPLASAKLMNALVAYEKISDLDGELEITAPMLYGSSGHTYGFKAGMTVTYRDLISAMLIVNANDAALILSRALCADSEEYVALMNEKAVSLGMTSTQYNNPTGIEAGSKTTVSDMLILLSALQSNDMLLKISGTSYTKLSSTGVTVYSRNYFLSSYYTTTPYINKNVMGGIASTDSDGLDTLLSVVKSGDYTYLVALSGAQRDDDCVYSYLVTNSLVEYGATGFEYKTLIDVNQIICSVPVKMGNGSDEIAVFPACKAVRYLEKNADLESRLHYTYRLNESTLTAPVSYGDKVGTLFLYLDGQLIEQIDLTVRADVTGSSSDYLLSKAEDFIKSEFFIKAVIAFVAAFLLYILAMSIIHGQKNKRLMKQSGVKRQDYSNNESRDKQ